MGVVPLWAGAGGVGVPASDDGCAAARWTGGAVGGVALWAGAGGVGVPASDDGRAVARCTGGVPDAVPLSAGAEEGVLSPDGCAAARWTGGVVGVAPLSVGAVAAGSPLPDGAGVRRAGASAAAALPGRAGEPDGRAAARWTGGVVGGVALWAGAGGVGVPASDDGRAVARCTGGVVGAVPLSAGAGVAGLAGLPVPDGAGVARRAGASGAGLDGRAAARWTGGAPGAVPPWAGAEGDGLPPPGRRTGAAGAVASADAPGAGAVPGAGTARWTGAPVGAGAGVTESWAGEAPPAGAEPGSARSASADEGAVPEDDAVPEDAGAASVVRRLAGNALRCTAADPDGALVSDCRGRGAAGGGGTGDTRTPRGAWAGVLAGTAGDAVPAERARWTGVAEGVADDDVVAAGAAPGVGADLPDVPDAPPRALGAEPLGADGAVAGASAGIARSGATGIRCTGGEPAGRARGVDEVCRADESKAPDSRLSPAAGSSTAGEGARVNDGSCHVGRRPPKAASATPVRSVPVARWIGGRPVQAATATGAAPGGADAALPPVPAPGCEPVSAGGPVSEGEPAADAAAPPPFPFPPPSSRRPRSRSRSPTDQPSAVPRVTRDAIWSVYRRRSWCSRSRIASRLQWKW
ncbi:hypothetical protein RKD32_003323 [Streptomyces sp. SAI-195]